MKEIICNIDMFGDQRIWLKDNNNNKLIQIGNYNLEDTQDNLILLMKKENCNKAILVGGPSDFAEPFAANIRSKAIGEYGFENIEIEVR